jgi:surfeit locus 1 family protein
MTGSLTRLFVTAGLAFAILIGLGVWQLERLTWKTELLRQIDAAEAQPAVDWRPGLPDFAKVRITGRWRAEAALFGAEGRQVRGAPVMGARLLGVLERDGAGPVLVDRGWVPGDAKPAAPAGEAVVEGWMHPPATPGWFAAADDLKGLRFYTLDPARIAAALGVGPVAPFVLVALGPPGTPDPARALPRPPNDHLSYALTWFGLAAGLVGVTAAYARKATRKT